MKEKAELREFRKSGSVAKRSFVTEDDLNPTQAKSRILKLAALSQQRSRDSANYHCQKEISWSAWTTPLGIVSGANQKDLESFGASSTTFKAGISKA